ncbi:alpha/beta hydrolase family protein [Candidatus Nitrosocosmicus franklandus]|uniref:Alpha/beta hydrolase family protein n=1 Tax=Candidatus Nitrosocosmicus franklandianus TaxID=1798806 RepID=A0A484IFV4_9ARCH|nr:alpha/beta fold hydrolase [Candidatus Nitrosocosmicus franklandus]VFJ14891.1 Alpha/beta hydrolase family protein [Candidatus Nitrosocosmicus franklandus]
MFRPNFENTSSFFGVGFLFLLILSFSVVIYVSASFDPTLLTIPKAFAQSDIQTVKFRNLTIDLGNGVSTNAQISYPATGKGPFPGVLLVPGSGATDMNATINEDVKPFWQIANYLSERGFEVLRYDKRGIGPNLTIQDPNVWGNMTVTDLVNDAEKAFSILSAQPDVDPESISIVGHSEGTIIVPRIAIDNPDKVKNIVLMGTVAQNLIKDILYYQVVDLRSEYAKQILDTNNTGFVSINQIASDPLLDDIIELNSSLLNIDNVTKNGLEDETENQSNGNAYLNIYTQIKPLLIKDYENKIAFDLSKCYRIIGCSLWIKSETELEPNLSVIGNVSKAIPILILQGENDSATPLEQSLLLHQRLDEVNHSNHTLITYPNLGHFFYSSSEWQNGFGPIEPQVLADLYSWLYSHSKL